MENFLIIRLRQDIVKNYYRNLTFQKQFGKQNILINLNL